MDAKQTTDNVGYAISVFLLYLFDGLIAIDDAGLHQDGDDAISFQTYLVYCDFCGLQGSEYWIHSEDVALDLQITGLSESMKRSYWNETNFRTYQKLLKLQKETGHSLQALSLAYFFNQPFQTVPVTGVSNPSQLKDVLDACEIDLAPELFGGWVSAGGDR